MKKRLVFIYNPNAGKAKIKSKLSDIVVEFSKFGYEVIVLPTGKRGDASEFARAYAASGEAARIVCSGGDGTLSEVVKGVLSSGCRVPIGFIPAGTTNDFSYSLKIPKQPLKAAALAACGEPMPSDVGEIDGKSFIYTAAFGLFSDVSYDTPQNMKNLLGRAAYLLRGVGSLHNVKSYRMRVEFCESNPGNGLDEEKCAAGRIAEGRAAVSAAFAGEESAEKRAAIFKEESVLTDGAENGAEQEIAKHVPADGKSESAEPPAGTVPGFGGKPAERTSVFGEPAGAEQQPAETEPEAEGEQAGQASAIGNETGTAEQRSAGEEPGAEGIPAGKASAIGNETGTAEQRSAGEEPGAEGIPAGQVSAISNQTSTAEQRSAGEEPEAEGIPAGREPAEAEQAKDRIAPGQAPVGSQAGAEQAPAGKNRAETADHANLPKEQDMAASGCRYRTEEGEFICGMISNSDSVGGFKGIMGKGVQFDDGIFEMVLIRRPRSFIDLTNIVNELLSKKLRSDNIIYAHVSEVRLSCEGELPWSLDGEYGGDMPQAQIHIRKQAADYVRHVPGSAASSGKEEA